MTVRMHLVIKGRVQGVGFRWFTRETAQRFGIRGWVRNLSNGDVESQAEGKRDILDRFVTEIKTGPPFARVDEIAAREIPATGDTHPFDIY